MSERDDHIYWILNKREYADPFNKVFDVNQVETKLKILLDGQPFNDAENNIIIFLIVCNNLFAEIKFKTFSLFDKLNLAPKELRELFFVFVNNQFLHFTPDLLQTAYTDITIDMEKASYLTFKDDAGRDLNLQYSMELGSDILSELINLSHEWESKNQEFFKLDTIDKNEYFHVFHSLWIYSNILYNIKKCAYETVRYENGTVEINENDGEIRITSGHQGILLLKHAGNIRSSNNVEQFLTNFIRVYEETDKGVGHVDVNKGILYPKEGKSDISIIAKAHSNLFVFFPHFKDIKLLYFDGLSLFEILDILIIIENCIEKIDRKSLVNLLDQVPIKFKESELIDFLTKVTSYKSETIIKIISSLTVTDQHPYFWREPLYKIEDYLFFSLGALAAPNHCLFFDKWTALSGYSLKDKEQLYTKFVIDELKDSDKFTVVDSESLFLDREIFSNNILLETTSLIILVEVKLFNFPIESPEINFALNLLMDAAITIDDKANLIVSDKGLAKIILTNYTHFSGLKINSIPVADFTLFNNYMFVGSLKRASIVYHEGSPIKNEGGVIHYYKTDSEFNKNLKAFFTDPLPIKQILRRLTISEQQITHDFINPKFFTDIVVHITDEELMDSRIDDLTELLNYEYFGEPEEKEVKDQLEQSILYSLSEIFTKLAYPPYESYSNRMKLYQSISKKKVFGFAHLAFFILKTIGKLNEKRIAIRQPFKTVEYDFEDTSILIDRVVKTFNGEVRFLDVEIPEGMFNEVEEREIISLAIDLLSSLSHKKFDEDILNTVFIHLALLQGFSSRHNLEFEFYTASENIVATLNNSHKFQPARDFCEEILALSIKNRNTYYGWNILFKCYTYQKSTFDASIYGCLLLSSVSVLPELPNYLVIEVLYGALKFFRNFNFHEYAKYIYENLKRFDLGTYDQQKITLSYFNSFLSGILQSDPDLLDQILNYLEEESGRIIDFEEQGVVPWLALLYNIQKLKLANTHSREIKVKEHIDKFEKSIDKDSVIDIRNKILGNKDTAKDTFITTILNASETRSVSDFVYETQHLSVMANHLLQAAIETEDIDGLLLTGLAINDQSFTFQNTPASAMAKPLLSKAINDDLKLRLNNYKYYLLSRINLAPLQFLIWLFEDQGKVYSISIDCNKRIKFSSISNWDFLKMNSWLKGISDFYFNSKRDKFNNSRKEFYYDYEVQKQDYEILKAELHHVSLIIPEETKELLICSSIDLSTFPTNLIQSKGNFVSTCIPICNVISIERFIESDSLTYLKKTYSISAWIPADDQEPIISWGFNLLRPVLEKANARIHTNTYPSEIISSDFNIFLAHGVTDGLGFKAVYTNHEKRKSIVSPYHVFGKGKVAILFICNSGSSKEAFFANNIVSFSGELLKSGYSSVVAPYWPFDVTMSKIWLEEFLNVFNQGYSINESVWLANNKLSKYDKDTSSMFYAPSGCLAMHLYGNPNVYVES